jgi:hypothetical protein
MYVGRESADKLTDELEAAVSADLSRWHENEKRLAQDFSPIMKGMVTPNDVTSFIFVYLLPEKMKRRRAGTRKRNHKICELVIALEPDQFIGLVLLYAVRIDDRAGVGRAFDILMSTESPYRQNLKAYRDRHEGGRERAALAKPKLEARDQEIVARAEALINKGIGERNISGILAKEFKLSPTRIRQILTKTKIR